MRILEKALWVVALIGFLLALMFSPGGELMAACGLLCLGLFYMICSFALLHGIGLRQMFRSVAYSGISAWSIAGAILVGFVFCIGTFSVLFGVMLWQGHRIVLFLGLLVTFIVAIISAVRMSGVYVAYNKRIFTRMLPLFGLCVLFLFEPRYRALRIMYSEHPDFIEATEQHWEHRRDARAAERVQEAYRKMKEQ